MAKGYLYELTYTEEGQTYKQLVITTSATITEDSRFGWARLDDGKYIISCGNFNNGIKNIVTEETSEFGQVDYNHTTGNKVIIDYRLSEYGDLLKTVAGVTDDFVPESEGATYVFRTPSSRIEYVVGQTYSDGDGGYITFTGLWFDEINPDINIWPSSQTTACRIDMMSDGYYVWCPRT